MDTWTVNTWFMLFMPPPIGAGILNVMELPPPRKRSTQEQQALLEEKARKDAERAELEARLLEVKKKTREDKDDIIRARHRLKDLQSKLVAGGNTSLLDQEEELKRKQREVDEELQERRRQEEDMSKRLEEEETARLGQEEQYNSLQEEIEAKTKKLKKLYTKFKAAQAEIRDVQEEFNREKEDILDTIRKLSKQQALRQLIMTSYIPLDQLSKIERCSEWDEAQEGWRISRLQYGGNKMRAKREGKEADATAPDASPMRMRNASGTKDAPPVPDVSKAMAAVYFSYESEPAEADGAAMVEGDAYMGGLGAEYGQ